MTSIIEQRATELVAERQQQALTAFETEYKELLAPIKGSGLAYKVTTQNARLKLIFTLAATGDTTSFSLDNSGQVSSEHLHELTPDQLTEVLAEQLVRWEKAIELREWEQEVKIIRFVGQASGPLAILTIMMAVVGICLPYLSRPLTLVVSGGLVATVLAFSWQAWYKQKQRAYLAAISQSS